MNKNQANSIIAFSKQAEEYDYDALVKRLFPQSQDWAAITVGQNSLSDFIFLAKKVFRQFQSEFKDINNALAYPIYYMHSQYGQSTIDAQISNFLNHLNSNNINAADNYLQWLVGYQVQHGFYFKPIRRTSEITTSDLNRLSEQLNLHQKTISDKLEQVENLISELNNQRKQLQNLIDQKKDELNQITVNLSTSNTQTNQINELLNKSTEQSSRINTILEQQEDNKKQYNKNLSETLKLYDDAYAAIHEEERVIKSLIADFENQKKLHDDHLLFVQEKRTFFEERNNYLNNLIGREVGASLFETFKQRKAELTGPITFWRYSVPIMTIATVLWIFFLFSNQVGIADYNLWWQAFALNTLKLFLHYSY